MSDSSGGCGAELGADGRVDGIGGAEDGKGGGGGPREGTLGACGALNRLRLGGLVSGAAGACGACVCGAGGISVGGKGTFGADAGTIALLLSLTLFNFGMPPANRSPNCGGPPDGIAGAPDRCDVLAAGTEDRTDVFASMSGFDLSTVTAFLSFMPLWISPSNASRPAGIVAGGGGGSSSPGGGGGGGGGGPAILGAKGGIEEE